MVRNKINGKLYFGITVNDFQTRYYGNILKYTHNEHLKNSIEAYGIENFEINEQFDVAYNEDDLWDLEDMYICLYDTIKNGYNVRRSGSKHKGRGHFEHTNETKQKMSEKQDYRKRQVVCVNTGETFNSLIDAYEWVSGKKCNDGVTAISKCCRNVESYETRFKHPSTGEKIVWAWKHDYDKMTRDDIVKKLADAGVYGGATVVSFYDIDKDITYKQADKIDVDSLDYALRFLSETQLYIFKEIALHDRTLEQVANEIGRSKQSISRTYKDAIHKIQQRFTLEQFKEIITLN